jgi:hypothetical protein
MSVVEFTRGVITAETLTVADIRRARGQFWIDRGIYEAAMYGNSEAIDRVCAVINSRLRRDWIENVTP